uniref:Uncharacterized protein n=1 Tax=Fagus sylvatica TaxID=28930 RepID=A0A2N9F705_FAGSY
MAKPGSSPAPLITTADGGGFWLGLASLSSRGYWCLWIWPWVMPWVMGVWPWVVDVWPWAL